MIVVTGAAGFVGSCLLARLNADNFNYLIAVDDFSEGIENIPNLRGKRVQEYVDRKDFFTWLDKNYELVEFVFHIGARTDTTEFNVDIFNELNLEYSKKMWQACHSYQIPLVYASSAATYGNGEHGYEDNETGISKLKPLNPYGQSKQDFDVWALQQQNKPFFWAGLKFFNVYGPNESHKGRMASVIFHAYNQIKETGKMRLFRSHNPDFKDGEQQRDFIYVADLLEICIYLMHHRKNSGIYNVGTGKARTFLDLAKATFKALNTPENIEFVDTPLDIRDKYQYFTEASMYKLQSIGYTQPFTSLEEGVKQYVQNYLDKSEYS
jgi:ADP-L-glycero-D-manno-heptose 6-epimerase